MQYIGQFRSIDDQLYKIIITTNGDDKTKKDIVLTGDPFTTEMDTSDDTIYVPAKYQTATVNVLSSDYLFDIYSTTAQGTKVELYKIKEGGIIVGPVVGPVVGPTPTGVTGGGIGTTVGGVTGGDETVLLLVELLLMVVLLLLVELLLMVVLLLLVELELDKIHQLKIKLKNLNGLVMLRRIYMIWDSTSILKR